MPKSHRLLLAVLLLVLAGAAAAAGLAERYPQARGIFPAADAFGELEGAPPSAAVYQGGKVVGYLYLTDDVLRIPAYSGKPINTLVGLDLDGRIAGLAIVSHDEPILAVGITQERLDRYVAQYAGKSAFDKVIIGAPRPGHVNIDGISGATITVMVENASVMRSARRVAEARGISGLPSSGRDGPLEAAAAALATAPATNAATESSRRNESPPPVVAQPEKPVTTAHVAPTPRARQTPVATSPSQLRQLAPPQPVIPPVTTQPEEPLWIGIWRNRAFEIAVLCIGLALLLAILVFQDWLARHPRALTRIRYGFHFYTLLFIGWYGLAQLSVINVLTFTHAVTGGFRWENFLIDPLLFILWSFVAVTLLLWGRGVYCGWLCPFGALQELILVVARKLKLPEYEFSDAVHERLVALKYVILILLFGISLQSIAEAAWYGEVEPFKTVFALRFQRDWPYVLYALLLIGLAFFNRKFYCKYLCPLGAALAIPGRFRLFEWWLRRRKECGSPCQVCSHRCSVRAIRPTGEINANECHYCLDCQVIYYNDRMCVPLVDMRKRREQRAGQGDGG